MTPEQFTSPADWVASFSKCLLKLCTAAKRTSEGGEGAGLMLQMAGGGVGKLATKYCE